ncbi:hypothetical protein [Arenivirga flava]|uniref:Uncharacterized protein n=1 Tax=Arenivirga flava TaxID=1930060 RepID=A0AA37UCW9_9MICO|nr:hypothetical protein [Arenivirga flava]GMA27053.1 hypothetical protein GCM10025874_03060 [Arenivirga flava]
MPITPARAAFDFRELIVLLLRAEGVTAPDGGDITARALPKSRLGERFSDPEDEDRSDIQGLDIWHLTTNLSSNESRDMSGALDRAGIAAERDGKRYHANIWHRRGRPAAESYAVMPLRVLAELIRETEAAASLAAEAYAEAQTARDNESLENAKAAMAAEKERERNIGLAAFAHLMKHGTLPPTGQEAS